MAPTVEGMSDKILGSVQPGPPKALDAVLLVLVAAMVIFGLIMVYSSSYIYAQEKTGNGFAFIEKQVVYAAMGFAALFAAYRVNYRNWEKWAYPVLGIAVFLLALIFVPGIGEKAGGARRWIHFGPLHFQPGEFAKFAVIFFVARQLTRKQDRIKTVTAGVLSHFVVPLPVLMLLLLQPDFGTTVIISVVIFALMFLAGVPYRYLLTSLGVLSAIGGWLAIGTAYRRTRLLAFLDPWSDPAGKGFQILQSFVGLHQGRLLGVGLGNGKEKLFYLPEAHNDFIFSVIGEELGFVGLAAVVLAYLYFIYRGLKIAWTCQKETEDRFGLLLAAGITLALGLQGFVNISVVLGLLPTKGLTLPFISYGGSAILVDLFAVGVLLSVSRGQAQSQPTETVMESTLGLKK
jgi:cell division protein FtsW